DCTASGCGHFWSDPVARDQSNSMGHSPCIVIGRSRFALQLNCFRQFFVRPGVLAVYPEDRMNPQQPPTKIQLTNSADYRESYANSVQVRVSLWDFYLMFGIINQQAPDSVAIQNFQGIFMSPQQAKALANVLNQNVTQYEATFGEIKLEPKQA